MAAFRITIRARLEIRYGVQTHVTLSSGLVKIGGDRAEYRIGADCRWLQGGRDAGLWPAKRGTTALTTLV